LTRRKSRNADDFSKRASFANVGPNGGTFLERDTAMLKQKQKFISNINQINLQNFYKTIKQLNTVHSSLQASYFVKVAVCWALVKL